MYFAKINNCTHRNKRLPWNFAIKLRSVNYLIRASSLEILLLLIAVLSLVRPVLELQRGLYKRKVTRNRKRFILMLPNFLELGQLMSFNFKMRPMKCRPSNCSKSTVLFKVNSKNTRKKCEICSKLTINTPK